MKAGLGAVAVGALCWAATVPGSARPVSIGRHVEVPYGISPDHAWITEAGGPQRRGRARHPVPAEAPSKRWEARAGIGSTSAPAVSADGSLYVTTSAGLAALTPEGEGRWSVRLRFAQGTPSLTPEGQLLVATRNGSLVRVSPAGEVVNEASTGAGVAGPPLLLADGSVVVATRDMNVVRIDAEGRRLFRTGLPHTATRPPAWDGRDRILVPAGADLLILSTEGEVRTRVTLPGPIVAGPVVADDGTIWVLGGEGTLSAFDRHGRLRARTDLGAVASSSPLVVGPDGAVRVGTREGGLICVGPTGTERWRVDSEGVFLGGLTVDPEGVTLGITARGSVVAVGPNGQVRWRASTRPRSGSDPVIGSDGTVYVGTSGGTVQAFR